MFHLQSLHVRQAVKTPIGQNGNLIILEVEHRQTPKIAEHHRWQNRNTVIAQIPETKISDENYKTTS